MGNSHNAGERHDTALKAALRYLTWGWRPILIQPRGKQPLLKSWKEFQERAPEREEVLDWFTTRPDANVAVLTGAGSAIIALDVDGPEGEATLKGAGADIPTLTNITAKGRHLILAHPGTRIGNPVKPVKGIDVRGDGGYIVVPPSVHPSGHQYRWDNSWDLDRPPAQLPAHLLPWLLALVTNGGSKGASERVREGFRNDDLARYAGSLLGKGVTFEEALQKCHARNATFFDPPLPAEEVQRTVRSIAEREQAKKPAAVEPSDRQPIISRLSDVQPEAVRWLWRGYIPFGKLTVIEGDPGLGKSTLTLDLAARISTGREMPDGSPGGPARGVVLLTAEDGLADTVVRRLHALHADCTKIAALTAASPDAPGVSLPEDIAMLGAAVDQFRAALIVIDPLMAHLSSTVNSWSDQDVRRALAPLAQLGEQTGAAIVVVRHLNKKQGLNAMYRGGGSIGIIGAARAAYLVAVDPKDGERRVMAALKNNLAPKPASLAFHIEATPDGASRLVWDGRVELTADDLLREPAHEAKLSGAKTFLQDLLIGGPVPSAVLDAKASGAGIAGRTLKRARKELGVVSTRDGFGEGSEWMAALPFHSDQGEEGTMAPVAPGDALSLEDPVAERAAIMEFEGGLTRSEAEQLAGDEVGT